MYADGDYDLAGFCVGAAERNNLIDGSTIAEGDVIIGLASVGVHSNGFSLVRRVAEKAGLDWNSEAPFEQGTTLGKALLAPTRMYVKGCLAALKAIGKDKLGGFAHITGGGMTENVPRVLPKGLDAVIDGTSFPVPPVFGWLAQAGNIASSEMLRTFNCGIGMVVIVKPDAVDAAIAALQSEGEKACVIGKIAKSASADTRICTVENFDPQR